MRSIQIYRLLTGALLLGLLLSAPVTADAQEKKAEASESAEKDKKKTGFKDYDELLEDAQHDDGLFTIHMKDEKLYFEIPDKMFGKELLLVSRIAQLPPLSPYMNAGSKTNEQVVRWERKGKKVLLRTVSYNAVADQELPIYKSVRHNNFEPILAAFKIEAIKPDSTAVVADVTSMFTTDIPAIGGLSENSRKSWKVSRLDADRTFIDTARSYPINIEVRHTMTFNASDPPSNGQTGTISMQMAQSMIMLPEEPMQPRLADPRVGWFSVSQIDYSTNALKSEEKEYIRRWRLEPKDPAAYARGELVEPVKPIVYYLDPATPDRWRPYFKRGIENWNKAFEVAGFKNAIIAKDPPSPEEDPEFDPEDARYSVVRYVASTTRNATGPSVSDPRTGEILESDIIWYHNHLRSYRNRYLLETGAANPSARTLDTPEDEIGEMMTMVITHEVGHALGLPHNMKASSAYPVDSLRSGSFTQKYGIAATIMDYARYNYVAQPGDKNIRFVRQLGPYDNYAINWGYRYLPNMKTPQQEQATLNKWIMEHEGDPVYMFGDGRGGIDPNSQTECVGDDAVKASTYGMANLKQVLPNLIDWTSTDGMPYTDLEELYGEFLGVWNRYVGHVVTNIGGVYETRKVNGQKGSVYEPVPGARQQESVKWMLDNVFTGAEWLLDPEILQRISHSGAVDRIRQIQERHLENILDMGRLARLIEAETFHGSEAYSLMEMFGDLRSGIWSEIYKKKAVNVYRRNLQRAFLERMEYLLKEEQSPIPAAARSYVQRTNVDVSQSDIRPVVRSVLRQLKSDIEGNQTKISDEMTRIHLRDCAERIGQILDMEEADD
jgi:hypothetical protein